MRQNVPKEIVKENPARNGAIIAIIDIIRDAAIQGHMTRFLA